VGTVTKPGLAVPVGSPAINPVPLAMIRAAVQEVLDQFPGRSFPVLEVEISVPDGEALAEKTLNERLGIIGGISILGTTGIVKPISAEAWTATITASMEVAAAGGNLEIVLSTGRTSEAALQKTGRFKPEALIMMGDYLEFALKAARNYSFTRLHMAGMWAKILKAALRVPQTHVRFGALEVEQAIHYIRSLAPGHDLSYLGGSNSAREIHDRLVDKGDDKLVEKVCATAGEYYREMSGIPVTVYMVHYTGRITVVVE
jgi:cobalt-precorrin-5B (C1)-methyltransferase